MALLLLVIVATAAAQLGDVTRRDTGDTFTLTGDTCDAASCSEHGAGRVPGACACACPLRAPLFREDRELCVDDLPECSLATFGTGSGVQRIPFVFLPLKGQIIHPSREITFQGVQTPICAVSGAQFLTRKGFVDLRSSLDADVPFSLFRDEGRTFLQWSGEDELRLRMSGRVMVVRLLCRDVAAAPASPIDLRGVFTPCVAFRVQGTPPRHITNVTEVQFAPNAHTSEANTSSGLTVTEYVAISISSLLLGLIYVASVFLYLHIRKRKKIASKETARRRRGLKKKDGSVITEHDIVRINNERVQAIANPLVDEDCMVKKNPLLSMAMGRQFHEIKGSFPSDSGSNMSDSEDFPDCSSRSEESPFNGQMTSAIVHLHNRELKVREDHVLETGHRDEGIERLPDEHVSIVETTDDREIARPVGQTRRKLYFNPAYFEPQLMAEPPPAALEFLVKIREVIAIAKHKMASKRFQPVLNEIPEEETYPSNGNSVDIYQGLGSQRSGSVLSLKRENSRKKSLPCVGCPGCKSDDGSSIPNFVKYDIPACSNCLHNKGEKQNSIRKWLDNLPTVKQPQYSDFLQNGNQSNGLVNSLLSLPDKSRLIKQKSFSIAKTSENFYLPKMKSTLSVRSEPSIRSYNLPLPDFENDRANDCQLRRFYGQTVSRADDIRPIGLDVFPPGTKKPCSSSMKKNKFITNNHVLPDMVNEAIALDHCVKSYNHSSSDEDRVYQKVSTKPQTAVPRKISRSPQGDYETDSLERMSYKRGNITPTEYLSSSQASPSLSNALPLEEELTMRNDVYKSSTSNTPSPLREIHKAPNHYEIIGEKHLQAKKLPTLTLDEDNTDYSLVSEVYVNNNYNFGSAPTSPSGSECSMGGRKFSAQSNTTAEEKPGCLTIEVKDSPENYIKIHESDDFEPDTLDRKHSKNKELTESNQFSRKDLVKTLSNDNMPSNQRIQLRSSGTFKKPAAASAKFNSLRHVYEQGKIAFERPVISTETFNEIKNGDDNADEIWEDAEEWVTEEGRILTLELRHSKRQRQSTPPTIKHIKSLARPDVLPPLPPTEEQPIYEQPSFPPRRVESDIQEDIPKNLCDRSLSPRAFTKNTTTDHVSSVMKVGAASGPTRASVQSQLSDYENIHPFSCQGETSRKIDVSRSSTRRRASKSGINTNTFVKPRNEDNKSRFRRKKGSNVDDSGYLSSDSAGSRQVQRRIVIPKIVSCSESDDSENEARSESGAESVETHSVFFGSFRKLQAHEDCDRGRRDFRNCNKKRVTLE